MISKQAESAPAEPPIRYLFLLLVGLPLALVAAKGYENAFGDWLRLHFSLQNIEPETQSKIAQLLFVPLAAVVVVFVRLTLGLRGLGPFRSILLAVAFQLTGIPLGVIFLVMTLVIVAFVRPRIKTLKLAYFGRISMLLGVVAVFMVGVVMLGQSFNVEVLQRVAYFPIVVLCLVGDAFARTLQSEGRNSATWRAMITTLIALFLAGMGKFQNVVDVLLMYPELLVIQLGLILFISRKMRWKLLSSWNPAVKGSAASDSKTGDEATDVEFGKVESDGFNASQFSSNRSGFASSQDLSTEPIHENDGKRLTGMTSKLVVFAILAATVTCHGTELFGQQRQTQKKPDANAGSRNQHSAPQSFASDQEIEKAVSRSLDRQRLNVDSSIKVRVVQGRVTLRGQVATESDSRNVERTVRQIEGVQSVNNLIKLGTQSDHDSGKGFQRSIQELIDQDAYLSESELTLIQRGNQFELVGRVPYLYHRDRALDIARKVTGTNVFAHRLEVESQVRAINQRQQPISDRDVVALIADEFRSDPRIPPRLIRVSCRNGVVTLEGSVPSSHEKILGEQTAFKCHGVQSVDNRIEVSPR